MRTLICKVSQSQSIYERIISHNYYNTKKLSLLELASNYQYGIKNPVIHVKALIVEYSKSHTIEYILQFTASIVLVENRHLLLIRNKDYFLFKEK